MTTAVRRVFRRHLRCRTASSGPSGARDGLVDERRRRAESARTVLVGDESRAVVGQWLETHQGSPAVFPRTCRPCRGSARPHRGPDRRSALPRRSGRSRRPRRSPPTRRCPRRRCSPPGPLRWRRARPPRGTSARSDGGCALADVAASGANGSHEARLTWTRSPRRRPVRWMASRRRTREEARARSRRWPDLPRWSRTRRVSCLSMPRPAPRAWRAGRPRPLRQGRPRPVVRRRRRCRSGARHRHERWNRTRSVRGRDVPTLDVLPKTAQQPVSCGDREDDRLGEQMFSVEREER